MRVMFNSFFTDIIECEDGEDAMAQYEMHKPDWIFMDIEMKRKDGLTASKQILKRYRDANIIILTNHKNKSLKEEAFSNGVREYILKENMLDILNIITKSNSDNWKKY